MRCLAMLHVLLLTGCTAAHWTKEGASEADVQKAKLECEFEAAKHDVDVTSVTWQSELRQAQIINACMRSKGFSS